MTLTSLTPKTDERGVVIGFSGSGKSHLSTHMLAGVRGPILGIDPKVEMQKWRHLEGFRIGSVGSIVGDRYIYQPKAHQLEDLRIYNGLFRQAFERGNITVYIDEVAMIATAMRYPSYLRAIYQQGRSRGIRVIAATQRPSAIPPFTMSEATRFYAFWLNVPDDIKKTKAMVPGYDPHNLPRYGFYYFDCLGPERVSQIIKLD